MPANPSFNQKYHILPKLDASQQLLYRGTTVISDHDVLMIEILFMIERSVTPDSAQLQHLARNKNTPLITTCRWIPQIFQRHWKRS
jgi:hypothetical protein